MHGEYRATIDAKRRVALPSRLRDLMAVEKGDQFFITRGLDGCLWLLTEPQWAEVRAKLEELRKGSFGFGSGEARRFVREFYRRTLSSRLDGHGRVALTEELMKIAALEKDIIFVGLPDRVELWSPERDEPCDDWQVTAERLFG